jgi:peptidoglycan/LPS O-acetylase OafA/YrhL
MTLPKNGIRRHRPDIDGLRALAVLAVILFHINPAWLPGGFVGVDIFFVISGYLITGIITAELNSGQFTFRRFYERRIRRILPALWALLIICLPVSFWLMLPEDAEPMGKSAVWSSLAMANVYFWKEVSTDYFAPKSALFPFLHLWSLGVEEQFYVVWPVVLIAVWRFAQQRAMSVACVLALGIVLASTLLADWLLGARETRFAYYMLPSRAGELALGAALALARLPTVAPNAVTAIARFAALIGWSLMAWSFSSFSEHDPFPGWRALPPTLGAAALLLSGQLVPMNVALAPLRWGAAQWLGRCSYSAYLWHWPLLAWWRYLWGQPGAVPSLALLAIILLLARASQFWVEDPARRSQGGLSQSLLRFGLAPALLTLTMALLVARGEKWGIPLYSQKERESWTELKAYTLPAHHLDWVCQQHVLDPASLTGPKCEFGSGHGPVQILLMGDSHAAEFAPMFRLAAEKQGIRMRTVSLGACALLPGSLRGVVPDNRLHACERGVPAILERARDFPVLIIGGAWTQYARNDPNVWSRLEAQLRRFTAQGRRVVLLPGLPEFADYDAACPAKRVRVGHWLSCPAALTPVDNRAAANARLKAMAAKVPGVEFLSIHESLCAGTSCSVADSQGHYVYADPSHLSVYGSRNLANALLRSGQMPDLSAWLPHTN